MTDSRKIRALLIAGVLAALVAIPAFADARLQGTFVFDGDIHAAVIMNGPNFVWIMGSEIWIGNFTVSGGRAIFNITHYHDANENLWFPYVDTWNYAFSFPNPNRLVINNWVYLRH